jgi:hypothetical protein
VSTIFAAQRDGLALTPAFGLVKAIGEFVAVSTVLDCASILCLVGDFEGSNLE